MLLKDLKGLISFLANGGLLCFYPEILPIDEKNKSYPISVIF